MTEPAARPVDPADEPTRTLPLATGPSPGAAAGAPARPWRFARTLTARAVGVTCLVALISVLVTALVAVPIAGNAANAEARDALAAKATLVAVVLGPRLNRAGAEDAQVVARLRGQGVNVYLVRAGEPDRPGLPARVVDLIAANRNVPAQRAVVDGEPVLVAGRTIGGGSGVVLTQPRATPARTVWSRLWLALLAGLAAGAVAGSVLARRLARPIRSAANAATRLSTGDRSVRLAVEPPAEAAELAVAFNRLAAALATSEGRERDFLLSVSHELRTPLTTIKGYAEALGDGVVGADGAQRAGQMMLDEAERLDRLVSDLLVLARLEAADLPIELIGVDLVQLVAAAAEAWGGRCAAVGVLLRTELPDRPVPVRTDPGRVRQVLDGLCENALRVLAPGAALVLAVRPPGPGRLAAVEVRDGGPGFTDEDLAVVFERGALYRRYRGVRKVGSGLGLALAARLVRRLGGVIEAGHAPEGGARFTVGLPDGAAYPSSYQPRTSH
jgi:signal transduction histidine kinase